MPDFEPIFWLYLIMLAAYFAIALRRTLQDWKDLKSWKSRLVGLPPPLSGGLYWGICVPLRGLVAVRPGDRQSIIEDIGSPGASAVPFVMSSSSGHRNRSDEATGQ